MMGILEPLTEEEWGGLMVPTSTCPAPGVRLRRRPAMDYGAHSGDIREAVGARTRCPPTRPTCWCRSCSSSGSPPIRASADLSPFAIGVTVTGRNAGSYRVSISDQGMAYEPGEVGDLPAVLEFDAGGMVLTAFGRINGGNAYGDQALAERFLNLFYRI